MVIKHWRGSHLEIGPLFVQCRLDGPLRGVAADLPAVAREVLAAIGHFPTYQAGLPSHDSVWRHVSSQRVRVLECAPYGGVSVRAGRVAQGHSGTVAAVVCVTGAVGVSSRLPRCGRLPCWLAVPLTAPTTTSRRLSTSALRDWAARPAGSPPSRVIGTNGPRGSPLLRGAATLDRSAQRTSGQQRITADYSVGQIPLELQH